MSEEITEQHMHILRGLGKDHAKAKGQLSLLDHNRKILLSTLMKEKMINSNTGKMDSVNAQEREARADQRYIDHIKALAIAIEKESELAWEKEIVRINFETWKTKTINMMKEAKDYGVKK